MIYEFEGKTEKDAIDKAVKELNLTMDQFDVEILEIQKGGLFKKGNVKIRVHVEEENNGFEDNFKAEPKQAFYNEKKRTRKTEPVPQDIVEKVQSFLVGIVERMGYIAEITVTKNENSEVYYKLTGEDASHIIGKKGKTLDSLQFFANIYLSKLEYPYVRAVVDCENYRRHKEETIIRMAYDIADRVASTRRSILLEPMNPYERRLIHTTLSNIGSVETKSEGEGLYKQVRVLYKK